MPLPKKGYLMACFRGTNQDESLYILTSKDGITFTNANASYARPAGHVVRNVSVVRLGNRYWCCSQTGSWNQFSNGIVTPDIDLFSSKDGLNWSFSKTISFASVVGSAPTGAAWAPKWFIDDTGSVHIVTACSPTGTQDIGFQIYEIHPVGSSLSNWSSPVKITGVIPNNMIDPMVERLGDVYRLWYKNENSRYIEYAESTDLVTGYQVIKSDNWSGWGSGVEAPHIVNMGGNSRRIYIDSQGGGTSYSDTSDGVAWSPRFDITSPIIVSGASVIRI